MKGRLINKFNTLKKRVFVSSFVFFESDKSDTIKGYFIEVERNDEIDEIVGNREFNCDDNLDSYSNVPKEI